MNVHRLLPSYISQTDQNEVDDIFASQEVKADDNNSASDQPQQLYPISELFVALLHSTTLCQSNLCQICHLHHPMYVVQNFFGEIPFSILKALDQEFDTYRDLKG